MQFQKGHSPAKYCDCFLTPGLPSWIVCRGNWINGISQDMEKSGKSPVEVWSLRFVQ